jgi:hypothetical protein
MKSATVTAIVLFALPAAAFAQQNRKEDRTGHLFSDRAGYEELNFGLKVALPMGDLFKGQSWDDTYGLGMGLEIQYVDLYKSTRGIYGGWYGGLSLESFGGRRDGTLKPERLNLASGEIGVWFREDFRTFRFDQHIGVGATFYGGSDIEDSTGGPDIKFIDTSVNFLFTVGLRVGAPISDSCELGIGVAYRLNGGPKEGEDVSGTLNFKPLQEVIVALTLDFLF